MHPPQRPVPIDRELEKDRELQDLLKELGKISVGALAGCADPLVTAASKPMDKVTRASILALMVVGTTLAVLPTLGEMGILGTSGDRLSSTEAVGSLALGGILIVMAAPLCFMDRVKYYATSKSWIQELAQTISSQIVTSWMDSRTTPTRRH